MKKSRIMLAVGSVALAGAVTLPAFAQPSPMPGSNQPMFQAYDLNANGSLDRNEYKRMRDELVANSAQRDASSFPDFAAADLNKDGRISRAEAQAAQAKSAERFDERDVNKDGYLDRADMQARMAQRRGECFAKADADKNGQLSRAEFDRMGEACGRMHGDKRMPRNNPNPGPLPPKK